MIDEEKSAERGDYVLPEPDEYEQALSVYSDAYKDAYGFRPKGWESIRARMPTTQDVWNAVADLQPDIDEAIRQEVEAQERAYTDWRTRLNKVAEDQGVDFVTALRWDFQAEGLETSDTEFYCYLNGLSYTWAVYIEEQFANG